MPNPPKTFAQYLDDILNATYGQEVREAIYYAIQMGVDIYDTFRPEYNQMKADLQTRLNQLTTEAQALETQLSTDEATKEAQLISAKNALMAEVLNLLNAMVYVNEKTGVVTLTGRDIRVNKAVFGGETVKDVLNRSASNIVATQIVGRMMIIDWM